RAVRGWSDGYAWLPAWSCQVSDGAVQAAVPSRVLTDTRLVTIRTSRVFLLSGTRVLHTLIAPLRPAPMDASPAGEKRIQPLPAMLALGRTWRPDAASVRSRITTSAGELTAWLALLSENTIIRDQSVPEQLAPSAEGQTTTF